MRALRRHALIRLRTALSEPLDVPVVVLTGAATLLFWPGLTPESGAGWAGPGRLGVEGPLPPTALMLLWIFIWPMMAMSVLRGRVAGGGQGQAFAARAFPALPVSERTRAGAEALAVLGVVMILRLPGFLFGEWAHRFLRAPGEFMGTAAYAVRFAEHTLVGALVMLPFLLLSAAPARTIERFWLRQLLGLGLLYGAMKLGMLASLPGCVTTSALLSGLALAAIGREIRLPGRWRRLVGRPPAWHRRCRPPAAQLWRDLWLRPAPPAAVLIAAEAGLVLLEGRIGLPRMAFFLGSSLVFSLLFSFVALQPMASRLVVSGVWGLAGYRPGDFWTAWSVLPIRRETVLRGVYLYGLLTGAGLWAGVVGANLAVTWLRTGDPVLRILDGTPAGWYLLPLAAGVPSLAGFLTAAAVGDRFRYLTSGIAMAAVVPVNVLFVLLAVPGLIHLGVLGGLAVVGGVPAWTYLAASRTPPGREAGPAPGS